MAGAPRPRSAPTSGARLPLLASLLGRVAVVVVLDASAGLPVAALRGNSAQAHAAPSKPSPGWLISRTPSDQQDRHPQLRAQRPLPTVELPAAPVAEASDDVASLLNQEFGAPQNPAAGQLLPGPPPSFSGGPAAAAQPAPAGGGCRPQCRWRCESPKCESTCSPLCEEPRCETRCTGSPDTSSCRIKCERPRCSVVCGKHPCVTRDCPQCQTRCEEPLCNLVCPGVQASCHNVCEHPLCRWNCKEPTVCPKPNCQMICDAPRDCTDTTYHKQLPPRKAGEVAVQSFRAPVGPPPQSAQAAGAAAGGDPAAQVAPPPNVEVAPAAADPAAAQSAPFTVPPGSQIVQIGGTLRLPPGADYQQISTADLAQASQDGSVVQVGPAATPAALAAAPEDAEAAPDAEPSVVPEEASTLVSTSPMPLAEVPTASDMLQEEGAS